MQIRRIALSTMAALAVAAAGAPTADAVTKCGVDVAGGVLYVVTTEHGDVARLKRVPTASVLVINDKAGRIVTCENAYPDVTTIDTILFMDHSDDPSTPAGNDGSVRLLIDEPAGLAPGKTSEGQGASEIEVLVDTKGGQDELVAGGDANQHADHELVVGNGGMSWTTDSDADMIGMPFARVELRGDPGRDLLSGQGGFGTGAPLTTAKAFRLEGSAGGDVLRGSDITVGDDIKGTDGPETIAGGAGHDRIAPALGNDVVDGGPGSDTVQVHQSYGATVDLRLASAQETRQGLKTITAMENATGSASADRLIGDEGPNQLDGRIGDDTLEGRGGADLLIGGGGSDVVSYADAPGPITVDLTRGTQPGEGDQLFFVEGVIGSPFGDTLTGNVEANLIVGGAGADTIAGGDNSDRIEVRDGEGDRVACGEDIDGPTRSDRDVVVSDRPTLDVLTDCEIVDALPDPMQPGDGPTAPGTSDTVLSFSLRAASRQRLLRQRAVHVKVSCPDEACMIVASGSGRLRGAALRLRPLSASVMAGTTRTLKLRLTRKQVTALRRTLAAGRRPQVKLTVAARDAAGNAVRRSVRVTARR